jgi:hypothetical protein
MCGCCCRHMEAPDRFRAIQTYRAAMAIIAQQRQLIVRMYNTAILTENEREIMDEVLHCHASYMQTLLIFCLSTGSNHDQ